jgi:hypothetical protein
MASPPCNIPKASSNGMSLVRAIFFASCTGANRRFAGAQFPLVQWLLQQASRHISSGGSGSSSK